MEAVGFHRVEGQMQGQPSEYLVVDQRIPAETLSIVCAALDAPPDAPPDAPFPAPDPAPGGYAPGHAEASAAAEAAAAAAPDAAVLQLDESLGPVAPLSAISSQHQPMPIRTGPIQL